MKRIASLLLLLLFGLVLKAENKVSVTVSDGINNETVKSRMEHNLSTLLSEINKAFSEDGEIDYTGIGINDDVKTVVSKLWDSDHFLCTDTHIVEHCITMGNGYQIRNIPLEYHFDDGEEEYQEAVVDFSKQGDITNFHIAISMNLYMNVVANNKDMVDLRRRELILDYVEQFRTSYNQKDIKFLSQIFSEDALIITGKVIKQKPNDGIHLPDRIQYVKHSKQEYLSRLKTVFASNKHIRVTFDEIEVMRHPSKPAFYGVTLHQGYTSDRYHDDGYIFLLWDFSDESAPQIHVRTWQPDHFNGKKFDKSDVFNVNDFDI